MNQFISANREQQILMPYNLGDWLPENHMSRFIVDIVDRLNFKHVYNNYKPGGSKAYDPRMLLSLIFYGYSTGIFSSRKIETATYDSVAFRFISGNHQPDHDTISTFRKRFLPEIKVWFKEILLIGKELGLLKLGNIYIDGTKVQANASRHSAMSYEYIQKLEKQLEEEIDKLLDLANATDEKEQDLELDIPKEIQRREERLKKIQEAKIIIEQRAEDRYKEEKKAYDEKIQHREAKEKETGKKPKGKKPSAPTKGPDKKDQYNFTDSESRIMKTSKGFDQCYNGQAAVNDDMVILGAYSNAKANDKQEFIPTINTIPKELGEITNAVADTGYYSENNILLSEGQGVTPIISTSREGHNTYLQDILGNKPPGEIPRSTLERMKHKLKGKEGKEIYKKRKQTVEPVFGIIKEVLGFRRFSLRGEYQANNEWSLVCAAYNLKRFYKLSMG
jgi:transposase